MPNVTGLKKFTAQAKLESEGLILLVGRQEPSKHTPPGTVLSQTPLTGTSVSRGSTVTVVITAEASVPDLKGRSTTEATILTEQAGFKIAFGDPVPSDTIE